MEEENEGIPVSRHPYSSEPLSRELLLRVLCLIFRHASILRISKLSIIIESNSVSLFVRVLFLASVFLIVTHSESPHNNRISRNVEEKQDSERKICDSKWRNTIFKYRVLLENSLEMRIWLAGTCTSIPHFTVILQSCCHQKQRFSTIQKKWILWFIVL